MARERWVRIDSDFESFTIINRYHKMPGGDQYEKNTESAIGTDADHVGLCVLVGEFGQSHQGKDVDEAYIMEYCQRQDIGYLGWSWKGNAPGGEHLDIALAWDGSELSQDWGEKLINGPWGIRETAQACSVFLENKG